MVFTKALWLALWGALVARPAAALVAGNLMLFTNDITPTEETVTADLTPPTWASYAVIAAVLTGPFTVGGVKPFVHFADATWTLIGGDVGQTVYGFGLVSGGGALLIAGRFPSPRILSAVGDTVIVSGDPQLLLYPTVGVPVVEP